MVADGELPLVMLVEEDRVQSQVSHSLLTAVEGGRVQSLVSIDNGSERGQASLAQQHLLTIRQQIAGHLLNPPTQAAQVLRHHSLPKLRLKSQPLALNLQQ